MSGGEGLEDERLSGGAKPRGGNTSMAQTSLPREAGGSPREDLFRARAESCGLTDPPAPPPPWASTAVRPLGITPRTPPSRAKDEAADLDLRLPITSR